MLTILTYIKRNGYITQPQIKEWFDLNQPQMEKILDELKEVEGVRRVYRSQGVLWVWEG